MSETLTSLKVGGEIVFHPKRFSYVRPLGAGGTGTTFLFKEQATGLLFAIKKFDPKGGNDQEECYRRFVDEIKILLRLTHPNIVRIFDYYLYPEQMTGFLQMEYIDGVTIDRFQPTSTKGWNEVFSDIVSAFETIERNGILHRDIKPGNVMIDNDGTVKVIDFGFGKQYAKNESYGENSIYVNWPGTRPDEIWNGVYDHRSEIYYLGKMFASLTENVDGFDYASIVEQMTKTNPDVRFQSFSEVREAMGSAILRGNLFDEEQKRVFQRFADELSRKISHFSGEMSLMTDPETVTKKLEALLEKSILETFIQDNGLLINCFVRSSYSYLIKKDVDVDTVRDFYSLFVSQPSSSQALILQSLAVRLGQIKVVVNASDTIYDEDIPF